jgi:hypothetical protein
VRLTSDLERPLALRPVPPTGQRLTRWTTDLAILRDPYRRPCLFLADLCNVKQCQLLTADSLGHQAIAADHNMDTPSDPEARCALKAFQAVSPEVTCPHRDPPRLVALGQQPQDGARSSGRPAPSSTASSGSRGIVLGICLRQLREASGAAAETTLIFPISQLVLE